MRYVFHLVNIKYPVFDSKFFENIITGVREQKRYVFNFDFSKLLYAQSKSFVSFFTIYTDPYEKIVIMQKWTTGVINLSKRDEALEGFRIALKKQDLALKSVKAEIEGGY